MVRIRVLGPLEIDGATLPRRQRALLARLVVARGDVVPFDALADSVWDGERGPADVRGALHTLASRVRSALGGALVTRPTGYALDLPPDAVDAWVFEDGLRAGAPLDRLLAWWRGRAYDEFADGFAAAESARLAELRLAAEEDRIAALLTAGDTATAVAAAEAHAGAHPVRERGWALWMRALAADGRPAEASAAFHRLRARLGEDLGVPPGPEVTRLHERILRPAPVPVAGVPAPLDSFVGRAPEFGSIVDALRHARVVTLTGPGGIGKTRLAVEFARARLDDACWVDLAAVPEAAAVGYAFCDALALGRRTTDDVRAALLGVLGRTRTTLVVDNCEHVVDAAAALVADLVAHCPELTVLATSREPLAIAGERVVPVAPLPVDTAVDLLRLRLREAGDTSDPGGAELAAVSERFDGMPLALELAAARAAVVGLSTLEHSTRVPSNRRDRPDRHRDLTAVFAWSYRLLDGPERLLLRRLAVFPDWFSFDDLTRVCADDLLPADELAGRLGALVAKSFVVRRSELRAGERVYRLLVPVREFATARLAGTDEDGPVRRRHAEAVVAWLEEAAAALGTPAEPGAWSELAAAGPRLRAVHAWCRDTASTDLAVRLSAALHRYAYVRDDHEMMGWADAALALPGADAHPLRGVLLATSARRLMAMGAWDRVRAPAEAAVAAAPDDPVTRIALGDFEGFATRAGQADYRRAFEAAVVTGDAWGELEAAGSIAIDFGHRGLHADADRWLDRMLDVLRRSPSPVLRAIALYVLGTCRGHTDPAAGEAHLFRCHDLASRLGATFVAGRSMTLLTRFRPRDADLAASLAVFRTAIEQWRATGNRGEQWVTLLRLVPFLADGGADEEALALHTAIVHSPGLPPSDRADDRLIEEVTGRLGARAAAVAVEWTGADLPRLTDLALSAIRRVLENRPAR